MSYSGDGIDGRISPDGAINGKDMKGDEELMAKFLQLDVESILAMAVKRGRDRNILSAPIIKQCTMNAICIREELIQVYGIANSIDPKYIYRTHCYRRDAPTAESIKGVCMVGFTIMYDMTLETPSYAVFYIPGWGIWITCINRRKNEYPITRALIADFLDLLSGEGVGLVHYKEAHIKALLRILGKQPKDMNIPSIICLQRAIVRKYSDTKVAATKISLSSNYQSINIHRALWRDMKIDALRWEIEANMLRLSESTPKNPLAYSYNPEWKLRTDQMIFTAIQAISPVIIWEHGNGYGSGNGLCASEALGIK